MTAWRQEQRLDQVLNEHFQELPLVRQHYPQFFHKTDRWGRPVWIELLGHIDVDALLKVGTSPTHKHLSTQITSSSSRSWCRSQPSQTLV